MVQARPVEPTWPTEPVGPAEEERRAALPDPRLELVCLRLRDAAGLEVGVDLVDRGRLRRVLELLGRDAEGACDPRENGVAVGGRALGGGVRAARSYVVLYSGRVCAN